MFQQRTVLHHHPPSKNGGSSSTTQQSSSSFSNTALQPPSSSVHRQKQKQQLQLINDNNNYNHSVSRRKIIFSKKMGKGRFIVSLNNCIIGLGCVLFIVVLCLSFFVRINESHNQQQRMMMIRTLSTETIKSTTPITANQSVLSAPNTKSKLETTTRTKHVFLESQEIRIITSRHPIENSSNQGYANIRGITTVNKNSEQEENSYEFIDDEDMNNLNNNNNSFQHQQNDTQQTIQVIEETSGIRVWNVTVSHIPRFDMIGSFILPTLYLYAVTQYHGWNLEIIDFRGGWQEDTMRKIIELGDEIDDAWGTGVQDISRRSDFDPIQINAAVYDNLGFFPSPVLPNTNSSEEENLRDWIKLESLPESDEGLDAVCRNNQTNKQYDRHGNNNNCYIQLPEDPYPIRDYIYHMGGFESFFTQDLITHMRTQFLSKNGYFVRHFRPNVYSIAVHIRRGDISAEVLSERWIDQSIYAIVTLQICNEHPGADVHVFSSGKNADGDWSILADSLIDSNCGPISFHLDEYEIDTWAHMVVANAFIMSKSAFSILPSILSQGDVYCPLEFHHIKLSWFRTFNTTTGEIFLAEDS